LDGALVRRRLAERPPHDGGDEGQDGERQHHLDQREAGRMRSRLSHFVIPGRATPPVNGAMAPLRPLVGPAPGCAAPPAVAPGTVSAASSLAGSVRYCTTSKVWSGRPVSSQNTRTVTRRTDSCSPSRIGSMKLDIMPPRKPDIMAMGSLAVSA